MAQHGIQPAEDLFAFFRDRVDATVERQGTAVSPDGVYYLSQLLTEKTKVADAVPDQTLVELQLRALHGDRVQAVQAYRTMGDQALYMTGFFRARLNRGQVGISYYMDMGAAAYGTLSSMLRGRGLSGPGLDDVFNELGTHFRACSEVLHEVQEEMRDRTDGDILRLYEDWLRTASPRAAERLRELGVVPMRPHTDAQND
jgi:hypothetical protein